MNTKMVAIVAIVAAVVVIGVAAVVLLGSEKGKTDPEEASSEISMKLSSGSGVIFKLSLIPDHDMGGMQMNISDSNGNYSSEYFSDSDVAKHKADGLGQLVGQETIDTFEGSKTLNKYQCAYETYVYADSPSGTVYRVVMYENIYDTTDCSGMDETANCMLAFAFATGRMG